MKILGIDPGIGRLGWGVVESSGGKVTALGFGCIETHKDMSVPQRLEIIYDSIRKIIDDEKPDELSIEDLFFNTNTTTAFVVGQARGVVLLAASQTKLPVTIYTPLQVKMAVTGYGRAEKGQIGQMVKTILKLEKIPKPDDTADALAIAMTHAFSRKLSSLRK